MTLFSYSQKVSVLPHLLYQSNGLDGISTPTPALNMNRPYLVAGIFLFLGSPFRFDT